MAKKEKSPDNMSGGVVHPLGVGLSAVVGKFRDEGFWKLPYCDPILRSETTRRLTNSLVREVAGSRPAFRCFAPSYLGVYFARFVRLLE